MDWVILIVSGAMEAVWAQALDRSEGFSLRSEVDGVMTFRADNWGKKLSLLWEDEIKVEQYEQWIRIEGIRRGVARVQYRLDSFLNMIGHHE